MPYLFFCVFFFLMRRRPPRSTLFPYTTALPISAFRHEGEARAPRLRGVGKPQRIAVEIGRAHVFQSPYVISYAVFCLKKKKKNQARGTRTLEAGILRRNSRLIQHTS